MILGMLVCELTEKFSPKNVLMLLEWRTRESYIFSSFSFAEPQSANKIHFNSFSQPLSHKICPNTTLGVGKNIIKKEEAILPWQPDRNKEHKYFDFSII
jgi:hypothetical protein